MLSALDHSLIAVATVAVLEVAVIARILISAIQADRNRPFGGQVFGGEFGELTVKPRPKPARRNVRLLGRKTPLMLDGQAALPGPCTLATARSPMAWQLVCLSVDVLWELLSEGVDENNTPRYPRV